MKTVTKVNIQVSTKGLRWEETPKVQHNVSDWAEAVRVAKAISQQLETQVRLTEVNSDQGHYINHYGPYVNY